MRRGWRTTWYERHPEGLVGRLRRLLQSRPEAAHALIARLEREGWVGLAEDLQAPRAICPHCDGKGLAWAHPLARPEEVPEDLADEWWRDCGYCGGEGLVPLASLEEEDYAEGKGELAR